MDILGSGGRREPGLCFDMILLDARRKDERHLSNMQHELHHPRQ